MFRNAKKLYSGYKKTGRTNPPGSISVVQQLQSVDLFVGLVTAHFADSVLEHHILLEEVVYGHLVFGVVVHGALEEEAQEALYAISAGTGRKVAQQYVMLKNAIREMGGYKADEPID